MSNLNNDYSPHLPVVADEARNQTLYLELMKRCLSGTVYQARTEPLRPDRRWLRRAVQPIIRLAAHYGLEIVRKSTLNAEQRAVGKGWPADAETMIGLARLDNLQNCCLDVIRNGIPGDFIETGVWRGGACILMRAILKASGEQRRMVWVADSFQGLPKPDPRYAPDRGDLHWQHNDYLAVSCEEVKRNFSRYGLLDDQVNFLVGWFRDTLPNSPIETLAVLRLDGDMYESTLDALTSLYPRLAIGGYLIVDDYGCVPGCQTAVNEYRAAHQITEPIQRIDWTGVFWKKVG